MLIDRDSKPKDTIYYISGCILSSLKSKNNEVDKLFEEIQKKYNVSLEYNLFLLALNFLFLINKVEISKKGVLSCS